MSEQTSAASTAPLESPEVRFEIVRDAIISYAEAGGRVRAGNSASGAVIIFPGATWCQSRKALVMGECDCGAH